MKYFLSFTFICFFTLGTSIGTSDGQLYKGLEPEKLMKLKEINIMGVNLTMSVGDILSSLEKQGIKMVCSRGTDCVAQTNEFTIRIQHRKKGGSSLNNINVNYDTLPVAIGYSEMSGTSKTCDTIRQAINFFCSDGVDKHPCNKNYLGGVEASLGAKSRSSDGFMYSGRLNVKVRPKICAIRVQRVK